MKKTLPGGFVERGVAKRKVHRLRNEMNEQDDIYRWSAKRYRPDIVNGLPEVVLGVNAHQIIGIVAACLLVSIVGAVLLGAVVGKTRVLISLGLILAFVAMFAVAEVVRRVTRNKLRGHYGQRVHAFLAGAGLSPPQLVIHDGQLEQRRGRQRHRRREDEQVDEIYFEDDEDV